MRSLRDVRIKSTGITIASTWIENKTTTLTEALETTTHILIVIPDSRPPDWALFLLGFAQGRRIPLFVGMTGRLPAGMSEARCVALDQVDTLMLAERSKWEQRHRIELAQTRLGGRARDPDAFYAAALAGDRSRVEDFLVTGQSPDCKSSAGVPVLIGAVRARSTECVQHLVGAGSDPNAICGSDGTTALCEAASHGLATISGVLLAHNADPNHATGSGQTPLMLAASQGHAELVERLLSAGADPATSDTLGMSAAGYAKLFDQPHIAATLEKFGSS